MEHGSLDVKGFLLSYKGTFEIRAMSDQRLHSSRILYHLSVYVRVWEQKDMTQPTPRKVDRNSN